ncbi:MAG: glutamate--tRNA ligase [Patescibacteria group bacterium]
MSKSTRVRFAPSPTGFLHIGSLRTALYNYLFAKKMGGSYILRLEDTDQKRFVSGATENLIQVLTRMGVLHDEGLVYEGAELSELGSFGPYKQSERLLMYQEYVAKLLESGTAYHCFCSAERLEQVRTEQTKNKQAPKYDKHCLKLSQEEAQKNLLEGMSFVIRLNVSVERGDIIFQDIVRGEVKINARDIDDQVLMKSDGFPTYHLANVVDDHLMEITHVIRGEEWLPSTPKHVLLYEAFGWDMPEFAHLPLLLNPDKSKLSKRQGDVAVEDYLAKGYLEEALVNFVALLGWNPGQGNTQEVFSMDELVEAFDITHIHKAGAIFDQKKLDWMNGEYIKKYDIDDLYEKIQAIGGFEKDFIQNAPEAFKQEAHLKKVLRIEQTRLLRLTDFGTENPFLFTEEILYDSSILNWKQNPKEQTVEALEKAHMILSNVSEEEWQDQSHLESLLLEAAGDKKGDFLWPLRVSLTGAERSPSPFEVAWALGKEESLTRILQAIKSLS